MMNTILLLLGNVTFNTVANVLMKIGMRKANGANLSSVKGIVSGFMLNPALIGGVIGYVVSLGFYIFLLKRLDLSIAYPISVSCAIILVTVMSSLMLRESISVTQIAGTAIIMIGILVLTR